MNSEVNIEANLNQYINGDGHNLGISSMERYASFDYCYNYFQEFREKGRVKALADPNFLQFSCLQLGFYLASWGMYRGSSFLLQKSAKFLEKVVLLIAMTESPIWEIDTHCYTDKNIKILLDFKQDLVTAFVPHYPSDILATKIMLGVFGNVPAFDTYFQRGFGVTTFGQKALKKIAEFYESNMPLIEQKRIPTLSFESGGPTKRNYSRAKIIDMIFFIEGANKFNSVNNFQEVL